VNNRLRLPAVLNKFLQLIQVSAEELFSQWRSLAAPPLKLQELDPNASNLVASTTLYSESTRAMLCLKVSCYVSDGDLGWYFNQKVDYLKGRQLTHLLFLKLFIHHATKHVKWMLAQAKVQNSLLVQSRRHVFCFSSFSYIWVTLTWYCFEDKLTCFLCWAEMEHIIAPIRNGNRVNTYHASPAKRLDAA
ncbi:AP-2 complex subunit alpha-1-like protein, partial [Tanacetum coccineum]